MDSIFVDRLLRHYIFAQITGMMRWHSSPIDVEKICFTTFIKRRRTPISKCTNTSVFDVLGISTVNSNCLTKSGLFGAPLIDPVLIYEGTLLEWGLVQNCWAMIAHLAHSSNWILDNPPRPSHPTSLFFVVNCNHGEFKLVMCDRNYYCVRYT